MKNFSPQEYIKTIVSYENEKQKELDSAILQQNLEIQHYERSLQDLNREEIRKFQTELEQTLHDELKKYQQDIEAEFGQKLRKLQNLQSELINSLHQYIPELKTKIFNLWQ